MRAEPHVSHPAEGSAHLAHHYSNIETQAHAARLGMWLFLATELLLFGGMFVGYGVYRMLYSETFVAASRLIDTRFGAFNTFVLITSSLTVALAHHAIEHGKGKRTAWLLLASVAMGGVFMVVKGFEYSHHIHAGHLPGKFYAYSELQSHGAPMFFTLYFLMTGLHGLHVLIGMGVLTWLAWGAWRGKWNDGYATPVELGGLYWHLVDLIWIFLFPLLYLI